MQSHFLKKFLIFFAIVLSCSEIAVECGGEDFYKLLGIGRDANTKEIRKAFKKLAVKLHPDKNKDDENADANFAKLARAYEILKDPETRKHYDLFGDEEEPTHKPQYQSYTYYRDQFGIYDDDPLISTLTRDDYEQNIVGDGQIWFVNFYSAQCHHCHNLAPTWRKLALEFEGVIRIAAVNCEEDWGLCRQLMITGYPTLLYYDKDATMYQGKKFTEDRSFENLYNFVLSHLSSKVEDISLENWEHDGWRKKQWLLFLCSDDNSWCPEPETRKKLAAIFEGLMSVGIITDEDLCDRIYSNHKNNPIIFWEVKDEKELDESISSAEIHSIQASDTKEVVEKVLSLLPDAKLLTEDSFHDVHSQLRLGIGVPWLICFYLGTATELNIQLKQLPRWLPQMNLGSVHCGRSTSLCANLHVSHYPSWGILKVGGAFELHHGRDTLHEIVNFARDSSKSTNLHALSPFEFYSIVKGGNAWFIDWYAPWCPPCKKLMPEIRKASQHFSSENVQFGTVDCTIHSNLCSYEGIRAYPTTRLYNGTQIHNFYGVPNEEGIVEFVENMIHPVVIILDEDSFIQLIRKSLKELWIVDFYTPWCSPCQRLTPEWYSLAKQLAEFDFIRVAQLNCEENANLCTSQGIRSYPTIRLYPLDSKGLNTVAMYNGYMNAASLKKWVLSFLSSPVMRLTPEMFKKEILLYHSNYMPWIIDFYAPWCGHCVTFEPEFMVVAKKLEGRVKSAKVDCEMDNEFCRELSITSYPTVILYTSPYKRQEITTQEASEVLKEVNRILSQQIRDEL